MAYELTFTRNGVEIKKTIEDELIGSTTIKKQVSYEELSEINELELTVKSIKPVIENGTLKALKFEVSSYGQVRANTPINKLSKPEVGIPQEVKERLEEGNYPQYIREYTYRRYKKGGLTYRIAEIIKERERVDDIELREILKEEGYKGTGGSIDASIRVLAEITREIQVEGRGKNRRYLWIG